MIILNVKSLVDPQKVVHVIDGEMPLWDLVSLIHSLPPCRKNASHVVTMISSIARVVTASLCDGAAMLTLTALMAVMRKIATPEVTASCSVLPERNTHTDHTVLIRGISAETIAIGQPGGKI